MFFRSRVLLPLYRLIILPEDGKQCKKQRIFSTGQKRLTGYLIREADFSYNFTDLPVDYFAGKTGSREAMQKKYLAQAKKRFAGSLICEADFSYHFTDLPVYFFAGKTGSNAKTNNIQHRPKQLTGSLIREAEILLPFYRLTG